MPPSSGAVGGAASSTDKQAFLVAHLPVRMAGQLSPAAPSLGSDLYLLNTSMSLGAEIPRSATPTANTSHEEIPRCR